MMHQNDEHSIDQNEEVRAAGLTHLLRLRTETLQNIGQITNDVDNLDPSLPF